MRRVRFVVLGAVLGMLAVAPGGANPLPEAAACPMFPANNVWHSDVSQLPVHSKSGTYISSMGSTKGMHADFGAGMWDGGPIGIPYTVVPGTQPKVGVTFDYWDESDPGPYPIPPDAPIEGGPASDGDRHVLVVDKDNCTLYEMYSAYPNGDGTWSAGSGAVFDLKSNALRPSTWTSADAAGFAILPGLVRYDEVASGHIDHAIRMTAAATQNTFLWPARHQAGSANTSLPPMGLRLRLKASVDISGFSPANQVILQALKTYGAFIADNGSSFYISGAPDPRWDDDDLHDLGAITGSMFEAIDESALMVDPDSGEAAGGGGGGGGAPALSVGDASVTETNIGTRACVFTVTLSAPSATQVTFKVTTVNGTAVAPGDYKALSSYLVKVKPGLTSVKVKVAVNGDKVDEPNETFSVVLSAVTGGATVADGTGTGTILDND